MVSFRPPTAHALMWVDIETPGVPSDRDPMNFLAIPPIEVCVILTDFDLDPFAGYEALITPTPEHISALRDPENATALEMHTESGLLNAWREAKRVNETVTIEQAELDIIQMMKSKTTFNKGEFMIAGSGVAAFDYPLIKTFMPTLASWLAYFPLDIGIQRRSARILSGGRQFVEPNIASYGEKKAHRARADVEAHIEEARAWQEFYRGLP